MKSNTAKGSEATQPRKSAPVKKESRHHDNMLMETEPLHSLFIAELRDIYWAEKYLLKNLPHLINEASSEELKQAITAHFHETDDHIARLEKAFGILNEKPIAEKCDAMEGLMTETNNRIAETEEGSALRDAAIVCCAHKVEHYEIATYNILRTMATSLVYPEVEKLLYATLQEEENANIFLLNVDAFVDEHSMSDKK